MKNEILKDFFEKHIKGTEEKAFVVDQKMLLCRVTLAVAGGIGVDHKMRSVYITTKCLKHLYDKKPAEEFLFLVEHLYKIVRYPDKIYKNRESKRGEFCFIKKIKNFDYLCSIEIVKTPSAIFGTATFGISEFGQKEEVVEINTVTAFRVRNDKYLKNYTLLWDWGTGNPHRSALDTLEGSTNAPQ